MSKSYLSPVPPGTRLVSLTVTKEQKLWIETMTKQYQVSQPTLLYHLIQFSLRNHPPLPIVSRKAKHTERTYARVTICQEDQILCHYGTISEYVRRCIQSRIDADQNSELKSLAPGKEIP